jgi:hypothetical protein
MSHVSRIDQPDPLGDLKLVCTSCLDELGDPLELCSVEAGDDLPMLVDVWAEHASPRAAATPRP